MIGCDMDCLVSPKLQMSGVSKHTDKSKVVRK